MWESLQEYFRSVLHWWWVMVIGIGSGIIGYAINIWQGLTISIWVWIALAVLGLFVAQFKAFHNVRAERDQLKTSISLGTGQKVFRFEFANVSLETTEGVLMLNINFFATPSVKVENIQLETDGKRIPPLDWNPFQMEYIHTHQLKFNISYIRQLVSSGEHNFKLIAIVDGNEYETPPFTYYI